MASQTSKLNDNEVQKLLNTVPGWELKNGALQHSFSLPTFPAAIFFVNAVAHIAETLQHHPDIGIAYNQVTLSVSTHSAGGITEKDFALAHRINELWKTFS
jgi:4a-hydroxytetrahydrobiopterin dehydratase